MFWQYHLKNIYPKFMHLAPRKLLVLAVVSLQEKLAFEKAYWFVFPCFFSPPYTAVFHVPILRWVFQWKVFESFWFFHSTEERVFSCCWLTILSPIEMHCYPRTPRTRCGLSYMSKEDDIQSEDGALWAAC